MSGTQPDQSREMQDLWDLIDRELLQSYDLSQSASANHQDRFIPIGRIESAFKHNNFELTTRLLFAVFPRGAPVSARNVAEQCCRVFCILARLGKARFIQIFTTNSNLCDEKLPFVDDNPPRHFPTDTTDANLYKRFCEEQWKFYAPKMRRGGGVKFEQRTILPFTTLDRVGGGFTSNVYRAVIHHSHDIMVPPLTTSHCYAVKTFKRQHARRDYEKEFEAFRKITESGLRQPRGIIGFYASFEYRGSFNLLLEYADRGTLEDFFTKDRPSGGLEIIAFWRALFEVIKGLFWIHDHHLPVEGADASRLEQGFHQDLNTVNILVFSGTGDETYKGCIFKITDFGTSHFKTIMEGYVDATGPDGKGTTTYGAPECYSESSFAQHRRHNWVKRAIDIWSLGCIFSEAATWVVKGHEGVTHYRDSRFEATRCIQRFRGGDCFHDGERRLPFVGDHHLVLKRDLDYDDTMTGTVVENMVDEMTHANNRARPSAEQLDAKADRAFTTAQKSLQRQMDNGESAPLAAPSPPEDHPPMTQSSPTPAARKRAISAVPARVFSDPRYYDSPPGTMSLPNQPGSFPNQPSSSTSRPAQGSPTGVSTPETVPIPTHRLPMIATRPHAQSPTHSRDVSTVDSVHSGLGATPGDVLFYDQPMEQSPVSLTASPPINETLMMTPPPLPQQQVQCPLGCGFSMNRDALQEHMIHCVDDRLRHEQTVRSIPLRGRTEPAPPTPGTKQIPQCSLVEAWRWFHARKHGNSNARLPHHNLRDQLEDRDHVFMIDDSETMEKHWRQVRDLTRLLTYIVKKTDKDGVDVLFLGAPRSRNFTSSTKVAAYIAEHTGRTATNLDDRLNDDLAMYGRSLENHDGKRSSVIQFGSFGSSSASIRMPKKRSIYILTDGILSTGYDTQGQDAVRRVVERLLKAGLGKGQIGIQLISFGNDPAALAKLDAFDLFNPGLDIVDHEPSTGNVWKMLLGSINPVFDGDPMRDLTIAASS